MVREGGDLDSAASDHFQRGADRSRGKESELVLGSKRTCEEHFREQGILACAARRLLVCIEDRVPIYGLGDRVPNILRSDFEPVVLDGSLSRVKP